MCREESSSESPSSAAGILAEGDASTKGQPERGCPARGRRHFVQWGVRRAGVTTGPSESVLGRDLVGVDGAEERLAGAMVRMLEKI